MYRLEKFEKELSVEDYVEGYVDVDEFLECCKVCPNYGGLWSCPPYDFDVPGFWGGFSRLLIYGYKMTFEGDVTEQEAMEQMREVKDRISEELFALEAAANGERAGSAVSLCAGSCTLCPKGYCPRKRGEPCRYPSKMRYSLESLGANVGLTVSRLLGVELEWIEEGKVPGFFVLVGGLLRM